jgi:hypothetical protein
MPILCNIPLPDGDGSEGVQDVPEDELSPESYRFAGYRLAPDLDGNIHKVCGPLSQPAFWAWRATRNVNIDMRSP